MQKPNFKEDTGATLIIALSTLLIVSILLSALLLYIRRSTVAVRYETLHTQALYNARMGIDSEIKLIRANTFQNTFTQADGYSTLVSTVDGAVNQLTQNQAPFTGYITALATTQSAPSTTTNSDGSTTTTVTYSIPATLYATGTYSGSKVSLNLGANLTFIQTTTSSGSGSGGTGGGGGSGTGGGTPTTTTITSFGGSGSPIGSVSTGSIGIQGSGGGAVSGSGSTATVTGFPNLIPVNSSTGNALSGNEKGTVWLQGDGSSMSGNINGGTAILTGSNASISGNVDQGALISTGQGDSISGNVNNGPTLIAGSSSTMSGNANCGAIISGSNVTVSGNINGPLIALGNNITVSSVSGEVVVTGSPFTLNGNINNGIIATSGSAGSIKITGNVNSGPIGPPKANGNPTQAAIIENGSNVQVNGNINGQVLQFTGQPITVSDPGCSSFGSMTLSFASTGGSQQNVTVSINFSTTGING